MDIKDLEKQLEEVEKESAEADKEWEFQQALREYKGEDQIISFQKFKETQKAFSKKGFSSGILRLDELIEGFHAEDLVTVTAPTGQGKTSFCQNLTTNFSEAKIRSLWFSYEVPVMKFLEKFEKIPDGYVPKVLTDRSLVWIERKIVEGIVKFGVKVVFIDHLHYLFDLTGKKNAHINPSLAIGDIMRQLKILAKKYQVTIFIIAHTTKIPDDEVVTLDSIRDSSFVGQESDYVIALWRIKQKQNKKEMQENGVLYTNESIISVVKNRYTGALGNIKTEYKNNRFLTLNDYIKL